MARKIDIMSQINDIIAPLDEIGADAEKLAIEICDKHKKILRDEFKDEIQITKGKKPVYINGFTTIPLEGYLGSYGAKLWNKKYPLSHLLEDGHRIRNKNKGKFYKNKHGTHGNSVSSKGETGKGTNFTYGFNLWGFEEDAMIKEFEEGVDEILKKAGVK